MGARGPAPKRSTERRRRNKESRPQKITATGSVKPPRVSAHWHPIAKSWFTSLRDSGQSEFYEPSDWQAARYVAEIMSKHLKGKPSAVLFGAIWSAMTDLLTTEASRRRVRLEVERAHGGADTGKVAELDAYRKRVGA